MIKTKRQPDDCVTESTQPPLRCLFVSGSLGPGGAERQLVTLARELVARGHHVETFTYHPENFYHSLFDELGIPVHCHPKKAKFSPSTLRRLRGLMRTGRFDVVLSFLPGPNLWTILAAVGLRRRPIIIVSERTSALVHGLIESLIEATYRRADHVAVNSCHLRDFYTQKYDWMRSKISCIWNGVDLNRFHWTPLPDWSGPLRLLAVGRAERQKNWHIFIDALAIARDEYRLHVIVHHVGQLTGLPPADDQYCRQLKDRIASLNLTDNWHWLGPQTHIEDLLARQHALVHPSVVEGLPNVVCEALASGRPVLISNTLDHPRLVEDGRSGFLFDPSNSHDLAESLRRLRSLSAEQATEMSHAARRFAEDRLSTKRLADEYESLFYRLVAANSPSPKHPGA